MHVACQSYIAIEIVYKFKLITNFLTFSWGLPSKLPSKGMLCMLNILCTLRNPYIHSVQGWLDLPNLCLPWLSSNCAPLLMLSGSAPGVMNFHKHIRIFVTSVVSAILPHIHNNNLNICNLIVYKNVVAFIYYSK